MYRSSASVFSPALSPDEPLLWTGQPRQGLFLRSSDIYMIPFSLLWGGFAIFWEFMAFNAIFGDRKTGNAGDGPVFILPFFGLPFVLIGLYLIFGRFWFDRAQRKRTFYGITKDRILIRSGVFSSTLKSLNIGSLADITLSETSDGRGTITFGNAAGFGSMAPSTPWWPGASRFAGPCLDSIPDASRVYAIIRDAYDAKK